MNIYRRLGSAFTLLNSNNSFTIDLTTDYEFKIEAIGSTITVYNSTDNRATWSSVVTTTDANFTSGWVGYMAFSSASNIWIDNVSIKWDNF